VFLWYTGGSVADVRLAYRDAVCDLHFCLLQNLLSDSSSAQGQSQDHPSCWTIDRSRGWE